MELLICCAILLVTVVLVFLSARHSLRTMDENAGRAMKQISAHLSTRFDAVLALLEVAQGYAGENMAALAEQLRLRRALAELSPEQRELLALRAVRDLNYAQIAELLGVPEGTVKSRLARAREALRKKLACAGNFCP